MPMPPTSPRGQPAAQAGWLFPGVELRSLFCLVQSNGFRRLLITMIQLKEFDAFILCAIVANAALMASEDPMAAPAAWQDNLELIFTAIFTFEMLSKIIALGFVAGQYTYLRDLWNVLDFVVVVTAWLPWVLPLLGMETTGSTSGLRAFRVLRPLRSIQKMPSLKQLVMTNLTILSALPQLSSLGVLIGLFFIVFSTVGINLWQGAWRQRCHTSVFQGAHCDQSASDGLSCTHVLEYAGDHAEFCGALSSQMFRYESSILHACHSSRARRRAYCKKCRVSLRSNRSGWPNMPVLITSSYRRSHYFENSAEPIARSYRAYSCTASLRQEAIPGTLK